MMMRARLIPVFFWVTIATSVTVGAPAAAADAVQRTEDLVNAFKAVKPQPEDGSALTAADIKANKVAFAKLDGFFDFERIGFDPIAPHKAKFARDAITKFKTEFKELIRLVAYPDSGSFLEQAKYTLKLKQNKATRSDVDLHAVLEEEDIETTVTFHWHNKAGRLQIYDVSFDGSSLIKDYQNQFARIINKDGVAGLMKKLNKRLKKEREESVIKP